MATRIYSVSGPGTFRLVEAGTKAAAMRHVAKELFEVEVATQRTLVAAMQDGIKVEIANAEPASE